MKKTIDQFKGSILPLHTIWAKEIFCKNIFERMPEPELVMNQEAQALAYAHAGRDDGAFCGNHMFILEQLCLRIQPGMKVLDLCCGTGDILIQIAQLCPETEFLGIDLSFNMLQQAQKKIDQLGLKNVRLQVGDITKLESIQSESMDFVMSTMAIHHLSDAEHLDQAFFQIKRVMTAGAGSFIFDFILMNNEHNMHTLVQHIAGQEALIFQQDFYFSLRAAFSKKDFVQSFKHFKDHATLKIKFSLLPILTMISTKKMQKLSFNQKEFLNSYYENIPFQQKFNYWATRLFLCT
jgi:ubiquinone/menaquinone biosynthesis C-methylase UbiE